MQLYRGLLRIPNSWGWASTSVAMEEDTCWESDQVPGLKRARRLQRWAITDWDKERWIERLEKIVSERNINENEFQGSF